MLTDALPAVAVDDIAFVELARFEMLWALATRTETPEGEDPLVELVREGARALDLTAALVGYVDDDGPMVDVVVSRAERL